MVLSPGTKLGHFDILESIGAGGMGEVYRARDTKLDREVAIKVLLEDLAQNSERLARFEREAKTLASLNHSNIGSLYDFHHEDGIRFLVLELVEGETLADRIVRGRLTVKETLPLFIQIAEALEAAHENGIIHRDLKPENIKITAGEKVKVIDFGLAKTIGYIEPPSPTDATLSSNPLDVTREGTVLGTPSYMSPEQARGQDIDKRTDVWAFGCCLYETLTGSPPFRGDSVVDTFTAILEREPDWDELPANASESVRNLLRRCLEKDVRRRLSSAGDIALQLEESLRTLEARTLGGETGAFDELLDWRPEPGEPIPRRESWILESKLGEGGFGEVWLAAHEKTKAKRVFKFCFEPERVKGLRREVVLFRLLKESLGDRDDIAHVLEWEFDRPPYFLEAEYTAGGDLQAWAEDRGGIENVPLETRLELVAQASTALGAAHSVGVLHKDVKPGNILVSGGNEQGAPRIRLTDFGIGVITDPGALAEMGITAAGLTEALSPSSKSSGSGTRMYMAPELLEGKQATTLSDIYSLGVVLYQMVIGDFSRAVAPGWERDVDDELLREDIAACIDGNPDRRLQGASELGERLRTLDQRHAEQEAERKAKEQARMATRIAAQARRRRRQFTIATVCSVALTAAVAAIAFRENRRAEDQATLRIEAKQAQQLEARAREEADRAREEAEQREAELKLVSDFQGSMLSGVDVELMGRRLIEDLVADARAAMERRGDDEETIAAAAVDIEASLSAVNPTNVALRSLDRNVLARALEAIERDFSDQPRVRAALLQTFATTYRVLGLFGAAASPQEEALDGRRRTLGDEHPDTLTSINNMGDLLLAQGKSEEAEPYIREALEGRRRTLGDEHPDTLTSINNMGDLLKSQGKYEEAEPYFREALEARRRVLGDQHPDTLTSINSMGFLVQSQGHLGEAEPYFREALEGRRRVLGDEHPDTLTSIGHMGSLLQEQGKFEEAEPYYRETLEVARRTLGDAHPHTLTAIWLTGNLLRYQGKLEEAEPYFREALEVRRRTLGDEHPDTFESISQMGNLLRHQGKLEEAEPYVREASEGSRRTLGDEHPQTINSMNIMGYLLQSQGKLEEAEPYFREVLEISRRVLGEEHAHTVSIRVGLSRTLVSKGRSLDSSGDARAAAESWSEALNLIQSIGQRTMNVDALDDRAKGRLDTYAQALLNLDQVEEARPVVKILLDAGWDNAEFLALCLEHGLIDTN